MTHRRLHGLLLLATASARRHDHHGGETGAPAAQYENYVVALEWQPQWSGDACPGHSGENQRLAKATSGPDGAFARANLSLHGLWPNYDAAKHGGYNWPQYCNVSGADYPSCLHHASAPECGVDDTSLAAFNKTGVWQKYALMYAWSDLAAHEWAKHGSCTPFSAAGRKQYTYWEVQRMAFEKVSAGKGAALVRSSVGANVTYTSLHDAFSADVGGALPTLSCVDCALEQVWLQYEAEEGSLLPLIEKEHGLDMDGEGSCAQCDSVAVRAWRGCE